MICEMATLFLRNKLNFRRKKGIKYGFPSHTKVQEILP